MFKSPKRHQIRNPRADVLGFLIKEERTITTLLPVILVTGLEHKRYVSGQRIRNAALKKIPKF